MLEKDTVVVQRLIFPPGQWEGVHSHPPGQLFIHFRGGEWTVRFGDQLERGYSETGSVGWYGPVPLSADHESVNSGAEPIDLIWVTLSLNANNEQPAHRAAKAASGYPARLRRKRGSSTATRM